MSEKKISKCEEKKGGGISVEFRVFEKKELKGKYREKIKVFFGSVVCVLHTLGRHVVKHG